jgi:putative membrane protein
MRFRRWVDSFLGVLLLAVIAVSTLWLAASKQLSLYIHPMYSVCSIVACGLAVLCIAWSIKSRSVKDDKDTLPRARNELVLLAFIVGLLIIKPAVLSSDIASQRGVNSATVTTDALQKLANTDVISPFGGANFAQLNVKDWASLLTQFSDKAFFVGKQVDVSGFIVADEISPADYFFVSRFVVSCCAIDARPIGVPVYLPNWRASYKTDQWVKVAGSFSFINNRIALQQPELVIIEKPKDAYVY